MYVTIIEYIVGIIILNCYLLGQLRIRKINIFILPLLIPSSVPPLLGRSEFLTYIIFLHSEEFLITFLQGMSSGNKFFSVFVWESLCLSFLKGNFAWYKILGWWFVFQSFFCLLSVLEFSVRDVLELRDSFLSCVLSTNKLVRDILHFFTSSFSISSIFIFFLEFPYILTCYLLYPLEPLAY